MNIRKDIYKAGVLLLALMMVVSIIPAVTADDDADKAEMSPYIENENPQVGYEPRLIGYFTDPLPVADVTFGDGTGGAKSDVLFEQLCVGPSGAWSFGSSDAGGDYTCFDNFWDLGGSIEQIIFVGIPFGGMGETFNIRFYSDDPTDYTNEPTDLVAEFTGMTTDSEVFYDDYSGYYAYEYTITLPSAVSLDDGWISVQGVDNGNTFFWGNAVSGDGHSYQTLGTPPQVTEDRAMILIGSTGGGPGGDCIPDACDFYIDTINNVEDQGVINSLPDFINVTIGNNGDMPIWELKILADIYEKECGDSTIWCDDLEKDKYDPRYPDTWAENWSTWDDPADNDDDSGDTFVLQKDEFHSADQAWRCTAGKYRSTADSDVYVGRSEAIQDDYLEWHPANVTRRNLVGAAGAVMTFWHKAVGEYATDEDGNAIPIDYGWIEYSLDDGATWTEVPDFTAFDNGWEQYTIKIINTNANGGHYDAVCDAMYCDDDAENTLCIYEDFSAGVSLLRMRFNWHVNPCNQFEGWYIDDICFERVEEYELKLVHQTHEIIELDPCSEIEYEFPLGFDPEPDTWYQLCIYGQVFAPQNCEANLYNNELCIQFEVADVHDIACLGLDFINGTTLDKGDQAWYDITIKNVGTFPEINFPVDLKIGKTIIDKPIDNDFEEEDDSVGFTEYVFVDTESENLWRHTEGDDTIVGPRSVLPGDESYIYADEAAYPILKPNVGGLMLSDVFDFEVGDCEDWTFEFSCKWSLPEQARFGFIVWTADGYPFIYALYDLGGTWAPVGGSYANDWQFRSFDLDEIAASLAYEEHGEIIIPEVEFGLYYYTNIVCDPIGASPDPWGGFMVDNMVLKHTYPDSTNTVVDTVMYPEDFGLDADDALEPDEEATATLKWIDTEYCAWTAWGDTQLANDVDTANDVCCNTTRVMSTSDDYFDFDSIDLTCGDTDSLWHLCDSRPPTDDAFYWAGDESTGFYAPGMDDALIGEVDLSTCDIGAKLFFNTYYKFFDSGDYGEVYVRDARGKYDWYSGDLDSWTFLTRFTGESDWTNVNLAIPAFACSNHTEFKFRMVSNDLTESWGADIMDESEGWYVDDIEIYNLTTILMLTEDMSGGVPPAGWSQEEAGEWAQVSTSYAGGTAPEARLYYYYINGDYAWMQTQSIDTSGGALLEFKSMINHYSSTINCYVQSSNDGGATWNDITPWVNPVTTDIAAATYTVDPGMGTDTIIRWVFDGYYFYLNYWYLDDVIVHQAIQDVLVAEDDFEGGNHDFIWTTQKSCAGDYWTGSGLSWCIEDYPSSGTGLNNALVTDIDLTDEALTYAEVSFDNDFFIDDGCIAYIEFSADGGSSWITYWMVEGPVMTIGAYPVSFDLNEYLGSVVKMRLRYTTPGNDLFIAGGYWCVDNFLITYKEQVFEDTTAPQTTLVFDDLTGTVSLFAYDPTGPASSGVCVTYYKIDGGSATEYTGPFTLSEGKHKVTYWSIDCAGNEETQKTSPDLVVDTTAPVISITAPEDGLYLFGTKLIPMGKTICIGKVNIVASASDAGSGVNLVTFDVDGDSGYDASAPYEYTYKGMKFGAATITVTAYDNVGLTAQATKDITIFSLGLI